MTVTEYIKREDVLRHKDKMMSCDWSGDFWDDAVLCSEIEKIPVADVVEVKHGHWEYDPNGTDWNLGAWRCSLCKTKNDNLGMGKNINPYLFAGSKFCPHCGAKMDAERKCEDDT